jgi:Ribonuclease HI
MTIYTDGGCSGNPGPGGWAYVIVENGVAVKQESGADRLTTNNKMELTAVIQALKYVIFSGVKDCEIHTDSQYVKNGITTWIHSWKKKGWKTASGDPVKNQEYWMALEHLCAQANVKWTWVKGHAGNEFNELCDTLVGVQRDKDWD